MKDKLKTVLCNIGDKLLVIALLLLITSWLWLPPLCAQLSYGDWSCAYKKCVVLRRNNDTSEQKD